MLRLGWMTGIEPATSGATDGKNESGDVGSSGKFAALLGNFAQVFGWRRSLSSRFVRNVSSFLQVCAETNSRLPDFVFAV
jgi:hypothetical protein